jgi:uridine kinase
VIPLDAYYKNITYYIYYTLVYISEEEFKNVANINFDHPNMMDWPLIYETVDKVLKGEDIYIPNYNFRTC